MKNSEKILLIVALPIALWTAIFLIQAAIGHFMPPMLVAAVAAISGVIIGRYIASR
jgi:uncharacterized membrane-anchored protein